MFKEDDLVLCTVKRVEGANVFVEIDGGTEASLQLSEIAAGRIRNLREYVSLNKRIVCKVLKIINGYIQLSLRRVTGKERDEMLEKEKKRKVLLAMIKTIVKEPSVVIEKIKEKYALEDFYDEVKEDNQILSKYFTKEQSISLEKVFKEKVEKDKIVKKIVSITSFGDYGIKDIKSVLEDKSVEISYLGSSRFSVIAKAKEFKDANLKISKSLLSMENRAKEKKIFFEVKQ